MVESVVPRLDFGNDADASSSADVEKGGVVVNLSLCTSPRGILRVSPEQRRLHYLYQEYAAIARDPIEGIYITPSANNLFEWFGVLIIRAGIYCGGMFRFALSIPSDFPDTTIMPVLKFEDNLFHPLIQPKTNIADFSRYFPSGWQRDRNHIYQILTAVQGMFFRCKTDEPAKAPNPEAALLIRDELYKFKQLAREAVSFTPWDIELEPFREFLIDKIGVNELSGRSPRNVSLLLASTSGSRKKRGFSWVDGDHCQYMCDIFSQPRVASENEKSTAADIHAKLKTSADSNCSVPE